MTVRMRLTGLVAVAFALVTACGSGGGNGNKVASISEPPKPSDQQQASDKGDDEQKMRDFTKCMREHGVDMPEPKTGPGGGAMIEVQGGPGNEEKVKAADEACKHLLPNGGVPPKLDAKQLDEMRKQAKCLREHGVNMPDPDPNNPMVKLEGSGDPEKDKKAFEACGGPGVEMHQDNGGGGGDGPQTHERGGK